ncbi:MAG TPA: hypothetical protein VL728_13540 [Cyclobacteriaceae bacterium]|nr:hypothetical protein [Cyclobacteriaceae bacterium]
MKKCFFLAIAFLTFECSQKNSDPNPSQNREVYVAGYTLNAAGTQVAKFWRNGVATNLTDGTASAGATGIALSGPSVIVSGWDWSHHSDSTKVGKFWVNGSELEIGGVCYSTVAVAANKTDVCVLGLGQSGWTYWRNGSPTFITTTVDSQTTGVAVNEGDVFVSGFSKTVVRAQYWRNGVLIYTNSQPSVANAIAVSGTDVYLAGYLSEGDASHTKAVIWKNGIITELTSGQVDAQANSIFVSGSDVHVGGHEGNVAMTWKNGSPTNLSDGSGSAEVKSIVVKEGDVYAAGYEGSSPRLWKNGVLQKLSDSNLNGAAVSVAVPQ